MLVFEPPRKGKSPSLPIITATNPYRPIKRQCLPRTSGISNLFALALSVAVPKFKFLSSKVIFYHCLEWLRNPNARSLDSKLYIAQTPWDRGKVGKKLTKNRNRKQSHQAFRRRVLQNRHHHKNKYLPCSSPEFPTDLKPTPKALLA